MVVAPNHFKAGLALLLLISSCAKKSLPFIEAEGIQLNPEQSHVDPVSLDSLRFASGVRLWVLRGSIVNEGIEHPYQFIYNANPLQTRAEPIRIIPPSYIDGGLNQRITSKLIQDKSLISLSWRTNEQFLMIRTSLTSEH